MIILILYWLCFILYNIDNNSWVFNLIFSNFIPSIYFGLLTSLAMFIALSATLTTIPRLLSLLNLTVNSSFCKRKNGKNKIEIKKVKEIFIKGFNFSLFIYFCIKVSKILV